MKYRELGASGISVSEIGFGCWGIGGPTEGAPAYGDTDDSESKLALRTAFDLGVNLFDTSDLYGYGHSEKLIGEVFQNVRDQVVITTKVGFLHGSSQQNFSSGHIRTSLEASLQRLKTDYVDLYQLHSPSIEDLSEDTNLFPELDNLKAAGKIRAYGISVRSPEDGLKVLHGLNPAALQVNFNLVDQRAKTNGLISKCLETKTGLIIRTPLCFGFLTGLYAPDSKFANSDHRSTWSVEQIARWADSPAMFELDALECDRQTPAQMALRFCLSYSGVTTAIPGMLSQSEVEENVLASEMGPFSTEELVVLETVYKENEFFIPRS